MLLAGVLTLSGCASSYVITLNNGSKLTTASKPKLQQGVYVFKDAKGEEQFVSSGRVREIAPASMDQEEVEANKFVVKQPKQKHWYWPF